MALLTPTVAWSADVTLTVDEVWQNRGTVPILITTDDSPSDDAGILLKPSEGVEVHAGTVLKYRALMATGALLVREPL